MSESTRVLTPFKEKNLTTTLEVNQRREMSVLKKDKNQFHGFQHRYWAQVRAAVIKYRKMGQVKKGGEGTNGSAQQVPMSQRVELDNTTSIGASTTCVFFSCLYQ